MFSRYKQALICWWWFLCVVQHRGPCVSGWSFGLAVAWDQRCATSWHHRWHWVSRKVRFLHISFYYFYKWMCWNIMLSNSKVNISIKCQRWTIYSLWMYVFLLPSQMQRKSAEEERDDNAVTRRRDDQQRTWDCLIPSWELHVFVMKVWESSEWAVFYVKMTCFICCL